MQKVSNEWKNSQKNTIVNEGFVEVSLGVTDPDALGDATAKDNGSAYISETAQVVSEVDRNVKPYSTLEQNVWVLDGSRKSIPTRDYGDSGYVGDGLSDKYCGFPNKTPIVTIDFTRVHTNDIPAVTITWGKAYNEHAEDFTVTAYNGETVVAEKSVRGNKSVTSIVRMDIVNYDRITISIHRWCLPFHRVRIEEIYIGLNKIFGKSELFSYSHSQTVDPVSNSLPKSEVTFDVDNSEDLYNPYNDEGLSKYLMNRQEVKVKYGLKNDDNSIEWIKGGTFYLSEWSALQNGISATFTARDLIEYMNVTYYEGVYNEQGVSLYDLAETLFNKANLPLNSDGSKKWYVTESLKDIYTTSALPVDTLANLLQMIANAGCCVFYQDRNGTMRIEPFNNTFTDYSINLENSYTKSEIKLNKPIKSVNVVSYSYIEEEKITELYKGDIALSGTISLWIVYSNPSKNAVATVTNGELVSAKYYTNACELVLSGKGVANVVIQGNILKASKSEITDSSYVTLGYIESNGTQYIDTGYYANDDTRVVMDFEFTDDSVASLFGSQDNEGVMAYSLFWDGEQLKANYGEFADNTINIDALKVRRIYDMKKGVTTAGDVSCEYPEDTFSTPETLKLLANTTAPQFTYKWYKDGKWLDKVTESYLGFNGNKEEEGVYYCEVISPLSGEVTTSKECVVTITDDSLLSGARYTHNATLNDWYFNNNTEGDPNVFDENGEFLTDGNIFDDYWQDKYFAVKNMNPVIEFNLDEPITFKELDIYVCQGKAGIKAPAKVTIEYKPTPSSKWITVYDDAMVDSDLVLIAPNYITAQCLKFTFIRNGAYCFIDEIRAFSEETGMKADGYLNEITPNKNLLLGRPYTHTVTNWYQGTDRDNGVSLTDGIITGTFYGTDYLNAKQNAVTVEFPLDEVTEIRELYMKFITDDNASIYPPKVVVSLKINNQWEMFYSGETAEEFVLTSPVPINAMGIKLNFTNDSYSYIFVKEVEAFSRVTGRESNGQLKYVETSLIFGLTPASGSVLPTKFAYKGITDLNVLTNGEVKTDADTYTNNLTFSDDYVNLIYERKGMIFQEVRIVSHNPSDVPNHKTIKGIGEIMIHVDGTNIATLSDLNHNVTGGIFSCKFKTPVHCDSLQIMLRKNTTNEGWGGMSLSEIQVFRNLVDENGEIEPIVYSAKPMVYGNVEADGTPTIVSDVPTSKSVMVGERFKVSVAVSGENSITDSFASGRLYSCKIYEKDRLVRDFVPCKFNDSFIGLYDKVGKAFYSNAGSGIFLTDNETVRVMAYDGELLTLDNPLVTNHDRAIEIGNWVKDYLAKRVTVSSSWRIDPRLDALDIVDNTNEYNTNKVIMTNVVIDFNGAFRGSGEGTVM